MPILRVIKFTANEKEWRQDPSNMYGFLLFTAIANDAELEYLDANDRKIKILYFMYGHGFNAQWNPEGVWVISYTGGSTTNAEKISGEHGASRN